jgi:hypothetical protein
VLCVVSWCELDPHINVYTAIEGYT